MRVLVTGSRDWTDIDEIRDALDAHLLALNEVGGYFVLVHGDAKGADQIAHEWALDSGVEIERHPYWSKYGLAGGPMRNQHMVNRGADLVLAFIKNESRGATGCVEMARKAGLNVEVHRK